MTSKTVTILCRDFDSKEERLKVEFEVKSFKFSTLDTWIRSRFGLSSQAKIRFSRKGLETEFVPDQSWISAKSDDSPIVIATLLDGGKKKEVEKDSSKKKAQSNELSSTVAFSFGALTLMIALIGLYWPLPLKYGVNVVEFSASIDELLISNGIIGKKGCALEAFIAMICWSLTYMFVRRMMNPETSETAVRKYSPDAFFGGLASACSVVLKYYLQYRFAS